MTIEFEQTKCDHFYAFRDDDISDYDEKGIYVLEQFECLTCGKCWNKKTYLE